MQFSTEVNIGGSDVEFLDDKPINSGTRMLPDFADSDFDQEVFLEIGKVVNFGIRCVVADVMVWLSWMLVGGTRPKANRRAIFAGSVNAIWVTQHALCEALEPYYDLLDVMNPAHLKLLERATRPLPPAALANPWRF